MRRGDWNWGLLLVFVLLVALWVILGLWALTRWGG